MKHVHTWVATSTLPVCSGCGKHPTASPSQIETWWGSITDTPPGSLGCKRKWAYDRVTPRTQNDAAAFGDRVHQLRERWLRDGATISTATREGRCAMQGLDRLPMPRQAYAVEHEVRGDMIGVVHDVADPKWAGPLIPLPHWIKIDVVAPPHPQWSADPSADVEVIDHKTVKEVSRAKTREQLVWDPQWLTYARWAVDFGARRVAGRWEYLQRDGRASKSVAIAEDAATIVARHDELSRHVTLPMLRANALDPDTLPRNPQRCAAFGDKYLCPHMDRCWQDVDLVQRQRLTGV